MRKLLAFVALPGLIVIAACHARTDPVAAYKGHRLLMWVIDKRAHAIEGFDEGTIKPRQTVELGPAKSYVIRFETGPIETVTVTDFRTEAKEEHVPFKISRGGAASEGTKNLTSAFLHVDYGIKQDLASATIAVPIGTLGPGSLRELAGRKFAGSAEELEDLLLAAVAEPEYGDGVRLSDILEVYTFLGRSQRMERWLELLDGGARRTRLMAAAILTKLENEKGTEAFCDACLQSQGNEQVGLAETLCMMPASDRALATIVELIVAPRAYLTEVPAGVGVSGTDGRYSLIRALTTKYPKNRLGTHEKALRTWAQSKAADGHGGREIIEYMDAR
jgi:hypothetical protein